MGLQVTVTCELNSWVTTTYNTISYHLIEAEWCTYASTQHTNIGTDNGLSPGRHEATIWTNAGVLLIGPLGKKILHWNLDWNLHILNQENVFENVVW